METKLFPEGTVPEWTTPEWYAGRDTAPHLEQAGHRERLMTTAAYVREAVAHGARSVVDLGAGDGGLLSVLPHSLARWGYDLQQTNVDASRRRGVDVELLDVVADFDYVYVPSHTCVVATEMLEHLVDPHRLVRRLAARADFLVASSPYTETAAAHYEFHTWAWDLDGYRTMLEEAGWEILDVNTVWICQVVLAKNRKAS